MHDHFLHLLCSCVDNFSTIFSGKCLLPRSVHAESHQKEKHCISVWDRLGKPCDGVPSGVKTVELCDGSGTVYLKQELLNQHKAVLPVLNSELEGVWLEELLAVVTSSLRAGNWRDQRERCMKLMLQIILDEKDTSGKFVLTRMLWLAVAGRSFSA